MKRRILTTLLTMCMVLMLLRIPAYAGRAYCDICGKWVSTCVEWNGNLHKRTDLHDLRRNIHPSRT